MVSQASRWPVLTHYEGESLAQVAFPLGGIGTGTVSLGGRANLQDFEICNRPNKGFTPPWTFFALRTQVAGQPPIVRVLEGPLRPPFGGAFGAAIATMGGYAEITAGAGLPRMSHVALDAAYPFAAFSLGDPAVPLHVRLEAFNPLVPLDAERSGLPVAILRYVLENPLDAPVEATVAASLYNYIGWEPDCHCQQPQPVRRRRGAMPGGNINEFRQARARDGTPLVGLLMRCEGVAPGSPNDGTLALVALHTFTTWRRSWGPIQWNRHVTTFWDDLAADGRLDDLAEVEPSPPGQGVNGSVAVAVRVEPSETTNVTFLLCWHFPHRTARGCGWSTPGEGDVYLGNHYARAYVDAWDVALQVAPQLAELEEESLRFTRSFVESSLPQAVREAALNNVSTLRTQTCFRAADGHFYAFEGSCDDGGCCFGSCTHVWNYDQTTAFLFPELARDMRRLELEYGTLGNGMNCFRLHLPLGAEPWAHAAADGQMGVVIKCYRDWQLSGDQDFLGRYWPTIRSLVSFAWLPGSWDADQDGVMEGVQHNTYDVEFFGPNPLSGVYYLAALRAAEEMARAAGDAEFAARCAQLFARGRAWIDENLFNGEYYVQRIRPPGCVEETLPELRAGMGATDLADPDYQLGSGCLVDQLLGQWIGHVAGLGYLLDPSRIQAALRSLFRYNFRQQLHDHFNNGRAYALGDEAALLVCTWPRGGRPKTPFPYFGEAWTGSEYQAAAHMIYEGLVVEGLKVVAAARARFDGRRRNPWDEPECGHHYARALSAWSLVLALSGFHYSGVAKRLALSPRYGAEQFSCLWIIPSAWGVVRQVIRDRDLSVCWEIMAGDVAVQEMRLGLPVGARPQSVAVEVDGRTAQASVQRQDGCAAITLAGVLSLSAPQTLAARLRME